MREEVQVQQQTEDEEQSQSVYRHVLLLERGKAREQLLMRLICLNFFVLFCRPQDWAGLSILGTLRLPMIISFLVFFAWLPLYSKTATRVSKYMTIFLVCEIARGVLGRVPGIGDTIVRNDFWQFHTWKDLFLQFTSLCFPIIVAMRSERAMRMIVLSIAFAGLLLGFYAVTHAGKGPGGFLGDENDAALAMVMMLPFCVMLRTSFRGTFFQVLLVMGAVLLCAGIVATNSRGGFLGFAAVLALFFIRSDRKLITLAGGVVALLLALPFIPQEYIKEVVSIKTEVGENTGTVAERIDTWEVAFRVFKDPRHILFGVGLNNVPFWFGEYEDAGRGRYTKSLSGRAMHSVYFQLLPDLGIYGVLLIGSIFWFGIGGNSRSVRAYEHYSNRLGRVGAKDEDAARKPVAVDTQHELQILAQRLLHQARVGRAFAKTLNVAWLGTLVAGIGVSALYYPPLWFLTAASAAIQIHAQNVAKATDLLAPAPTKSTRFK